MKNKKTKKQQKAQDVLETGVIKVLKYTENKDGTATVEFEVDDDFVVLYKKEKGVKRATKKGIGDFVLELLEKGINKEDGYNSYTVPKSKE